MSGMRALCRWIRFQELSSHPCQLSIRQDVDQLMKVGKAIRDKIMDTPFQADFEDELKRHAATLWNLDPLARALRRPGDCRL